MKTALLIVDMLNRLEFPEGGKLLRHALPAARNIARLKTRFRASGAPVVYVNDFFGKWHADWRQVLAEARLSRGRPLAELLAPDEDDYVVLKPKHSGFFNTTLDTLLEDLGARRLVITGIAGNICVLFTVNDARMRDYEVLVPKDCTASNTPRENRAALEQMGKVLGVKLSAPRLRGARRSSRGARRSGSRTKRRSARSRAGS